MCGIIGYISGEGEQTISVLTEGLQNLEYRGYDSAGLAVTDEDVPLEVIKKSSDIHELFVDLHAIDFDNPSVGIGHTRWSTHGEPTATNAHPQTDCDDKVAVVHNGVISNYETLRTDLQRRGHEFVSETDTEVVPHLIEEYLDGGDDFRTAFSRTIDEIEGRFAIVAMLNGTNELAAARNGSPLVLGVADGEVYIASDVPAFLQFTDRVIYLEDGEIAHATRSEFTVLGPGGEEQSKTVETIDWDRDALSKGKYDHYMLKEIHEHPDAIDKCISGRFSSQFDDLEGLPSLDSIDAAMLVGTGTSHNAARYGATVFRNRGIPAQTCLAGQFDPETRHVDSDTLVIAVTQSGETADVLGALRRATEAGYETLTVTNVVASSAAREADHVFYIRSGPEIGVAATKTFSTQLLSLLLIATTYGDNAGRSTTQDTEVAARPEPERREEIADRLTAATATGDGTDDGALTDAIDYYSGFNSSRQFTPIDAVNVRVLADHAQQRGQTEATANLLSLLHDYVQDVNEELLVQPRSTPAAQLSARRVREILAERERRFTEGLLDAFGERPNQSHLNDVQQAYLVSIWDDIAAFGTTDDLQAWTDQPAYPALFSELEALPGKVETILDQASAIQDTASLYEDADILFVLGERYNQAVAEDAALKFSEITYTSAHALPPTELKHGQLALVTQDTPVIGILAGESADDVSRIAGNLQEAQARNAPIIVFAEEDQAVPITIGTHDSIIRVPQSVPEVAPVLVSTAFQLFVYYMAKSMNQSIDKPRNLAKSVTVE